MAVELTVRRAAQDDVPALLALQQACFPPALHDTEADVRAYVAEEVCLVAVEGDGPGAMVRGAIVGKLVRDRLTIYAVEVDPAWQGRGVGRVLIAALLQQVPAAVAVAAKPVSEGGRRLLRHFPDIRHQPVLTPVPVDAVGSHPSVAFATHDVEDEAHGCGLEMIEVKEYPVTPEATRLAVERARVGLSAAYWALGLRPAEVCAMERGALRLPAAEWTAAFAALATLPTAEVRFVEPLIRRLLARPRHVYTDGQNFVVAASLGAAGGMLGVLAEQKVVEVHQVPDDRRLTIRQDESEKDGVTKTCGEWAAEHAPGYLCSDPDPG